MEVGDLENALPDYVEPSVHVEICQNPCSTLTAAIIKEHVMQLLHQHRTAYGDFILTEFDDPILIKHVKSVAICDTDLSKLGKQAIDLCHTQLDLHVFQLQEDGAASEELDDDNLSAASHWILPAVEFHGMWENLIFDSSVKEDLLHYAATTLLFSDQNVDCNVISWNRVILLHGPPGTGKTSLCKALAQKLCIRLSNRYSYGQLIEINSHSLFSKWFSESGKLVMKMFQKIQEFIDNQDALICVLIDEVESLTAARKSSMSGAEPSDAIRVVNALLTQIDQIKKHPNVIILTTSNVTGAIDLAFVDRADIKQYIGHPSPAAVFKIYHSCLCELMRKRIIQPLQQLLDLRALEVMEFKENDATKLSMRLWEIANQSHGLSGRTLRKLPFLAHALYIQTRTVSLKDYLAALSEVVKRQFEERGHLESS
ncbi:pachytene checkpoint protein 2 homolog [Saccoglossus kowalevskii]|uniref:Pachytene checkpoint protein 2 homolog n=1 Tax=Saccoglossus kowalevskii TaxID=10224 RepID=A0A1B1JCG4_SACKO|nr:pachytene checkpoint protein 2-like protein [Saccoglossus kowalevskii]